MAEWFEKFYTGPLTRNWIGTWENPTALARARTVKKLLGLRKGDRLLDLPCGKGRLAVPLARMGVHVTGVDIMAAYVRCVRKQARIEGLPIQCIHYDMRKVDFESEFDSAITFGGSFGFFSDEDNLDFCRRAFRALKPGGRFLLDGMNRRWVLDNFLDFMVHQEANPRIVSRNSYDEDSKRVFSRWTFSQGKQREVRESSIWMFDAADIRKLLRAAGFGEIKLFGVPGYRRVTKASMRIFAVAKKPVR